MATIDQLAQSLQLYDPRISKDRQCSGYYQLKRLVEEKKKALDEQDLVAFHQNLRKVLLDNWENILKLEV